MGKEIHVPFDIVLDMFGRGIHPRTEKNGSWSGWRVAGRGAGWLIEADVP